MTLNVMLLAESGHWLTVNIHATAYSGERYCQIRVPA